jgi:hypothetical protein
MTRENQYKVKRKKAGEKNDIYSMISILLKVTRDSKMLVVFNLSVTRLWIVFVKVFHKAHYLYNWKAI